MTGPEHLLAGKERLAEAAATHDGTTRAGIAQEATAHFLAAQVIAFAAVHLPERVSWQQAGDA